VNLLTGSFNWKAEFLGAHDYQMPALLYAFRVDGQRLAQV
jgi:hypothetical protein